MQTINIKKTESGFSIKFPFELKDNFRENFKTAKWNSTEKQWEVGSRSGKKLEQWAEIARSNLPSDADIAEYDERSMLLSEIEKLQNEASLIKNAFEEETRKIASAELLKVMAEKAKAELAAAQRKLDAAKAETAEAEFQAKQSAISVFDTLNGLIDVSAAKSAGQTMSRAMRSVDRHSKQVFSDAQDQVSAMRNSLKNAGFRCEAIEFIATANKNRPDRDNPSFVTEKMWLNIWKIEE